MYPVLFKFGNVAIYTYGLFIALGFLSGIAIAKKEAKRVGEDPERITDLCFFILIAAIVGSRLFYVITAPEAFMKNPLEIFRIWNGGLVFFGGFIGSLVTTVVYLRWHGMHPWKTLDLLVPGGAFGHFLGRIGCFFAGCCYGEICHLPWAVTFTNPESLAPTRIPLHPTQLYSALNNLIIFAILWGLRKRKRFHGQVFLIYVFLYGITRSIIEVFRGDFRGQLILERFTVSQTLGVLASVTAAILIVYLYRRHRAADHG